MCWFFRHDNTEGSCDGGIARLLPPQHGFRRHTEPVPDVAASSADAAATPADAGTVIAPPCGNDSDCSSATNGQPGANNNCTAFEAALGGERSTARAVVVLADGFALFGTTNINSDVPWDARLVRTDKLGDEIWAKSYGGPYGEFGTSLVALADGFAFAGSTSPTEQGKNQGWLVRTDTMGNVVWQQTFPVVVEETFFALVQLPDGFAAAGRIIDAGSAKQDMSLRRTDANGNLSWSQKYGTATEDVAYGLARVSNGFALAGSTGAMAGGGNVDGWLVATDKNGVKLWDKTYGGGDHDSIYGMAATTDGFVLVGSSASKFWVIRTDGVGEPMWQRVYTGGSGGGTSGLGEAVQVLPDGFAIAGRGQFDNGSDAWLLRTDLAGNPLWDRHFGSKHSEDATALALLPDGFVLAGDTQMAKDWLDQMWLVRTDAWGHATCATAGVCLEKSIADCDDANVCTADLCDAATGCAHTAWPDGTVCTAGKVCASGTCQ